MNRKPLLMILAFLLSIGPALLAHHGPKKTTIDAAAKKQPGVLFDHGKHSTTLAKSCDTCHHTHKGVTKETDKDVKKCSTCHLKPQGKMGTMADMTLTKNPMHVTCINCHKTAKKGPVACTGCHVKK
jgi:hypothetical protein